MMDGFYLVLGLLLVFALIVMIIFFHQNWRENHPKNLEKTGAVLAMIATPCLTAGIN